MYLNADETSCCSPPTSAAAFQVARLYSSFYRCILQKEKKKSLGRATVWYISLPPGRRQIYLSLSPSVPPLLLLSVYAGSWGRLSGCSETMVGFWKCVCWTCGGGRGGGGLVWLCLAFLCVHPSVPPSAGMGTRRVELGVAGISGSATLAAGFNVTVSGAGVSGGRAGSAVRILSEGVQVPPNKCKGQ